MVAVLVLLGLVVLVAVAAISIYNGLVTRRNGYKNAFSQIDVQLKRRYDLIPNLVETVKGYAAHEKETLDRVIQARNVAMAARGVEQQGQDAGTGDVHDHVIAWIHLNIIHQAGAVHAGLAAADDERARVRQSAGLS